MACASFRLTIPSAPTDDAVRQLGLTLPSAPTDHAVRQLGLTLPIGPTDDAVRQGLVRPSIGPNGQRPGTAWFNPSIGSNGPCRAPARFPPPSSARKRLPPSVPLVGDGQSGCYRPVSFDEAPNNQSVVPVTATRHCPVPVRPRRAKTSFPGRKAAPLRFAAPSAWVQKGSWAGLRAANARARAATSLPPTCYDQPWITSRNRGPPASGFAIL